MAFIIRSLLSTPLQLGKQVLEGIVNEVDKERLVTEEGVKKRLKELQLLLDEGKISEADYAQLEADLVERLKIIRKKEE
ncbi:MAG: hypothetical protein KBH15_00410 [Candidatus Atribacteria bacterium]|nr:hypothetical protein [Candidatus Atribacteria bacterium]